MFENDDDQNDYSHSIFRNTITQVEADKIELEVKQAEEAGTPLSMDRYHEIIRTLAKKVSIYGYAPYDPQYGDDRLCKCGHPYHRHFDSYEDMSPVGCKYCNHYDECQRFEEAKDA